MCDSRVSSLLQVQRAIHRPVAPAVADGLADQYNLQTGKKGSRRCQWRSYGTQMWSSRMNRTLKDRRSFRRTERFLPWLPREGNGRQPRVRVSRVCESREHYPVAGTFWEV